MSKRSDGDASRGRGVFVMHDVSEEVIRVPAPKPQKSGRQTIRARQGADGSAAATKIRRIIEELESVGPGSEVVYLGSIRALGPRAIAALGNAFPGVLWFDRDLPHRKVPRGRDVSPIARLLYALGEAAYPAIASALGADLADVRFYAVLLAIDVGADRFVDALTPLASDGDEEIASLVRTAIASSTRRAEEP